MTSLNSYGGSSTTTMLEPQLISKKDEYTIFTNGKGKLYRALSDTVEAVDTFDPLYSASYGPTAKVISTEPTREDSTKTVKHEDLNDKAAANHVIAYASNLILRVGLSHIDKKTENIIKDGHEIMKIDLKEVPSYAVLLYKIERFFQDLQANDDKHTRSNLPVGHEWTEIHEVKKLSAIWSENSGNGWGAMQGLEETIITRKNCEDVMGMLQGARTMPCLSVVIGIPNAESPTEFDI